MSKNTEHNILENVIISIIVIMMTGTVFCFYYYIDIFTGIAILYGHYLAGFLFLIGFIFKIIKQKFKNDIISFFSGLSFFFGFTFTLFFILEHNSFNDVRRLEPSHISIIKLDQSFKQNNIKLAAEASSFSSKIYKRDVKSLILMNKLEKNKKITILLKQNFISKKEFYKIKVDFIERHENSKDEDFKEMVRILKQKRIGIYGLLQ